MRAIRARKKTNSEQPTGEKFLRLYNYCLSNSFTCTCTLASNTTQHLDERNAYRRLLYRKQLAKKKRSGLSTLHLHVRLALSLAIFTVLNGQHFLTPTNCSFFSQFFFAISHPTKGFETFRKRWARKNAVYTREVRLLFDKLTENERQPAVFLCLAKMTRQTDR